MAILWCGGEDIDFPTPGGLTMDSLTPNFRSGYARAAVQMPSTSTVAKSASFPGGAITSGWLTARFYINGLFHAGKKWLGFGRSGTDGGLAIGGAVASSTKLALIKTDGTTSVELTAEVGNSITTGTLHRLDVQVVNFGANATVNVYVDGSLLITYTGDVTSTGVTNLDSVYLWGRFGAGQFCSSSEIIVADEDTRNMSLVTLAPNAVGDTNTWSTTTVGVNAYTDINETTAEDAKLWGSNTADQDAQVATTDIPTGSFAPKVVKLAARCARSGIGSIGSIALGTKVGMQLIGGGGTYTTQGNQALTNSNTKRLIKLTPTESCSVSAIRALFGAASISARIKALIYSDSSGSPNSLLATSTEVIGIPNNLLVDFIFSSPYSITAGTSYWFGWITDTQITFDYLNSGSMWYNGDTYSDGPSNPVGSNIGATGILTLAIMKAGQSVQPGTPVALDTVFSTKEAYLTLNPATGTTWTATELNALQLNFRGL